MNYKESAEGLKITKKRALKELEDHGVLEELAYFYEDLGNKKTYDAQDVLSWLGH